METSLLVLLRVVIIRFLWLCGRCGDLKRGVPWGRSFARPPARPPDPHQIGPPVVNLRWQLPQFYQDKTSLDAPLSNRPLRWPQE